MFHYTIRITTHVAILTRGSIVGFAVIFLAGQMSSQGAEPSLTTLRKQTQRLLKIEANTDDQEIKNSSAHALCDLYVVLRSDPRYATSPMLRGDAAQLRKRLMRISERHEMQLHRAQIPRPNDLDAKVNQALALIANKSLSDNRSETPPAGAGGGAAADEAWQLIELIQRIIAPDFWQPQGGPGAIRYFAIKRALVVRATSDVHQQVRELLMALR